MGLSFFAWAKNEKRTIVATALFTKRTSSSALWNRFSRSTLPYSGGRINRSCTA